MLKINKKLSLLVYDRKFFWKDTQETMIKLRWTGAGKRMKLLLVIDYISVCL